MSNGRRKTAPSAFLLSSSWRLRLAGFLLLLAISQHRIAYALRVSFISCGAVQPVRRKTAPSAFLLSSCASLPLEVISRSTRKVTEQPSNWIVLCLSGQNSRLAFFDYSNAATPPTISVISCVIAAWRARLYCNVSVSINSFALSVAVFIADIRAACSLALPSRSAP